MKSLQADFFKVMKEGAIQYAAPLPFLDLVCVGTATQTEVEEQVDLMYSLIHQQVDAIVLVPIDSKALVQPVVEAVRKGVPVINIDIRLDTQLLEQAGVEVAFVGPDNFAAAYEVGKLLDKKLRNEDKVAIIEGLAAADNAQQRKRGFIKAIEEKGLRLVASEPADWETEKAAEVFQAMWMRYPDLKAVYCSNDAANPAISYALSNAAPVVAMIWGVFVWKEFKEAPKGTNKLIAAMFSLFIIGLISITLSN